MSKEEVREIESEEVETEVNELDEEMECSYKDIFDRLSLEEEVKRIDLQDKPISKASKEVKESKVYKETFEKSHTIGECMQILLGYGIDYTNALSIALTLVNNKDTYELQKVQSVQTNNQQI